MCSCPRLSRYSYRFLLHLSSFFFNDTATTEIYTLSLHDALPILTPTFPLRALRTARARRSIGRVTQRRVRNARSEEHTSELQSLRHLVCRLLLEKKKIRQTIRDKTEFYNRSRKEMQARIES